MQQLKKQETKQSLTKFFQLIQPERKIFIGLLFCSLIGNALVTAMPFIMGIAIDDLLELIKLTGFQQVTLADLNQVLMVPVLILIVFAGISSMTSYIQEATMAKLSEKITLRLRKEITKKFKKLPISFFDQHQVGDILSRTTTDLNRVSQVLLTGVNQFFSSVANILFAGFMLFYIDYKMTLIVLALMLVSSFVTKKIALKNKELADKSQSELGILNNQAEEFFAGSLVTKTFNQQDAAKKVILATNKKQYQAFKNAQFMNYAIYPAIRFINQLAFIISGVLGAILVIQGAMSIGVIQAYLQYVNQISEPITTSSYVINDIQGAMASIDRIFAILEELEEVPEKVELTTITKPKGEIRFKEVQFGYSPDQLLMKKVDFTAKARKTIAIVGPTGAGKTTLVNLLLRFYEINGGMITFDGHDITNLSRKNLRSMFGMVLQNTWLFEGTVADNIAYGKRDATREEIIQAAKVAQCDHFIRTLPNGYESIISSEGGLLSQGQQQLLTIARIILANPPVVILDEATSSVDTRTEAHIQQAMNEVTKDRTSFVIAHRLSTIENADLILVMKAGTIIEQGNHQELLDRKSVV